MGNLHRGFAEARFGQTLPANHFSHTRFEPPKLITFFKIKKVLDVLLLYLLQRVNQ